MNPITFSAFTDELQKIALPRAVQEWRKATAAGQGGTAEQIAQSYGSGQATAAPNVSQRLQQYKARKARLGLAGRAPSAAVRGSAKGRSVLGVKAPAIAAAGPAPRYLKDISVGGQEGAVDLMMGSPRPGVSPQGGVYARKLYKPDSPFGRGENMTRVLEQKQRFTDTARGLSPEARQMVPGMYGHKQLGKGPNIRHTSAHEFVPGVSEKQIGRVHALESPKWKGKGADQVRDVKKHVLDPMKAKGMRMDDVANTLRTGVTDINTGNLVSSPQGPKVIDFLPEESAGSRAQTMGGRANPVRESLKKWTPKGQDMPPTPKMFGRSGHTVQDVRKEVFNPSAEMTARAQRRPLPPPRGSAVSMGAVKPRVKPRLKPPKPVAGGLGKVLRAGPLKILRRLR